MSHTKKDNIIHLTYEVAAHEIPWLVSYPRCGCHWLRMMIERIIWKACLPRAFYMNPERVKLRDIWGAHKHDTNLRHWSKNVIYLYRDPVDFLFSRKRLDEKVDRNGYTDDGYIKEYAKHMIRWRFNNEDCERVLIITYEELVNNGIIVLSKIFDFIGETPDPQYVDEIYRLSTKDEVRSKLAKDTKIVDTSKMYAELREEFRAERGEEIYDKMRSIDRRLVWE